MKTEPSSLVRDTAERMTDEALRVREARFRTALDNSPAVIFEQDAELRYTWIYKPGARRAVESTLGKTDEDFLPADEARDLTRLKRSVLESGEPKRQVVRVTTDGSSRYFDVHIEPQRGPHGKIVGLLCASWEV